MRSIEIGRVSTLEQKDAGNSLPAQAERQKKYREKKGFVLIEAYSFEESAYKTKRDEFDVIVERIQEEASKEKIAVCFDKVDRLSRSVFDKRVALLYEMALDGKIELHFVSEGQVVNSQMSAVEKFQFSMSLGLAKYYSDAIGDNVRRAFEQKRRNGEWTGQVRLGYLNVSLDAEKRLRKDIILDPDREHLVRKMFELYVTGNYSLETIRIQMTNEGLRSLNGFTLSKSCIENMLKDSFYCGIATSKKYGSWEHKYPRLISRDIFERCQDVRQKRNQHLHKALSREFIFGGLLKCHRCDCAITFEHTIKPSGKEYNIGSCTNGKKICRREYVNEKHFLKPVYELLERFESITEEAQIGLVDELRKNTEAEVVYHKAQIVRVRDEYEQIKIKDDRLLEAYLSQSITKDVYDRKHQEFSDKLQLLEVELSEHRKADYDYQTTVATVLSVARRAKTIFENSSDVAGKRAFLNYLLQNPTVDGEKLYFTVSSPFNLVLELAESYLAPPAGIEPATNRLHLS